MLSLDLPYLPNEEHLDFLASLGRRVASIYIGLENEFLADARPLINKTSAEQILADLSRLKHPRKYLLANAAFQPPELLLDSDQVKQLTCTMERFVQAGQIQGIIYTDPHLLFTLARTHPELAVKLEAVPSVNLRLDRLDSIQAHLETIKAAGFRSPSQLVLDRSLNRRMDDLKQLSRRLRRRFPDLEIFLLANEGCLYQCPFKTAHDGLLAHTRPNGASVLHRLSRELGCLPRFDAEPHQLLKSPIIRPEDMGLYEGVVQGLKLCGRNRSGPDFVIRAALSYLKGSYSGNLLLLTDVLENLGTTLHLENSELPPDFGWITATCSKDCESCRYCIDLASRLLRRQTPSLSNLNG